MQNMRNASAQRAHVGEHTIKKHTIKMYVDEYQICLGSISFVFDLTHKLQAKCIALGCPFRGKM